MPKTGFEPPLKPIKRRNSLLPSERLPSERETCGTPGADVPLATGIHELKCQIMSVESKVDQLMRKFEVSALHGGVHTFLQGNKSSMGTDWNSGCARRFSEDGALAFPARVPSAAAKNGFQRQLSPLQLEAGRQKPQSESDVQIPAGLQALPAVKMPDVRATVNSRTTTGSHRVSITSRGSRSDGTGSSCESICETPRAPATPGRLDVGAWRQSVSNNISEEITRLRRVSRRAATAPSQKLQQILVQKSRDSKDQLGQQGLSFRASMNTLRHNHSSQVMLLDTVMGAIVILNVVVIGVSADLARDWLGWIFADCIFAVLYTGEFVLKMVIMGCRRYFCGPDKLWNIFELTLLVMAMVEICLSVMSFLQAGDNSAANISLFRVIRLLRVVRIVSVCRLQMFAELMDMVNGTLGGIRTLGWSMVLINLPLFLVSLVMRETLGKDSDSGEGAEAFATVSLSFFTMFRCIIGGDCADANGRPIFWHVTRTYGWGFGMMYGLTAVFMFFGLFNVIVALFVESVVAAAKTNELQMKRRRMRDQAFFSRNMMNLVHLLWSLDQQDGERPPGKTITRDEEDLMMIWANEAEVDPELFEVLRKHPEYLEICQALEVSDEDQFNLFETLDVDGSGTISIDELVEGISKLRGDARRSDIISLSFMMRKAQAEYHQFFALSLEILQSTYSALVPTTSEAEEAPSPMRSPSRKRRSQSHGP